MPDNSSENAEFILCKTPAQVVPFALFMTFIGLEEVLRALAGSGFGLGQLAAFPPSAAYPIKAIATAALLVWLRKSYRELDFRDLGAPLPTLLSATTGVVVFVLWIRMDWGFATIGKPGGYNPGLFGASAPLLAGVRLLGAAAVVPVMEELFWRSFLLRYLIAADFAKVPIGRFTWPSFLISSVLFGLEHNMYLAGIMAGVAYNLLLYRTKSVAQCVLSHAVTNLLLGIYVLYTGSWQFW